MSARYRHRRTSTAATAFPTPVEPGEIVANTANRQLVIGDAASATLGAPLPLLAVRYFDARAQYAIGDFVVNAGTLYRANTPISPNPFNPAQWDTISSADVSKAYVDAGDAAVTAAFQSADTNYLLKAGGTMSGALTLAADPATNLQASTKQYVDGKVASIPTPSSLTVSDTPPTGVPDGALWWESDSGLLYVKYNDGNTTQWVIACPQPDISSYALKTDVAPAIAASAVRYDAGQSLTATQQQTGRQNIFAAPFDAMAYSGMQINGGMEVDQPNSGAAINCPAGSFIANLIDGFVISKLGTNVFAMQQVASVFPGYNSELKLTVTTAEPVPGSDYITILQKIEGYRFAKAAWGTANAQPVTVGFWVKSSVAGNSYVTLSDGTNTAVQTITIAAANTPQFIVVTFPGQTTWVGSKTNGVGATLTIYPMAPGQLNIAATVGNTYEITGVIVLPGNQGPTAAQSPFVMRSYDQELQLCMRYYEKLATAAADRILAGNNAASNVAVWSFKVRKRIAPTLILAAGSAGTVDAIGPDYVSLMLVATFAIIPGGSSVDARL